MQRCARAHVRALVDAALNADAHSAASAHTAAAAHAGGAQAYTGKSARHASGADGDAHSGSVERGRSRLDAASHLGRLSLDDASHTAEPTRCVRDSVGAPPWSDRHSRSRSWHDVSSLGSQRDEPGWREPSWRERGWRGLVAGATAATVAVGAAVASLLE